jgi:hypothetical protein
VIASVYGTLLHGFVLCVGGFFLLCCIAAAIDNYKERNR